MVGLNVPPPIDAQEVGQMLHFTKVMHFAALACRERYPNRPPPGFMFVSAPFVYVPSAPGACRCAYSPGRCWS